MTGMLWQKIMQTTERAVQSGALLPIPTEHAFIEDRGVRFFVRVLTALRRKDEERNERERAASGKKHINPFLPPEPDLLVGDVSDTHAAVLNKFNVVDHHLLIITKEFEQQYNLLTLKDFEALWACMAGFAGLGFYNGGAEAGASQPHKHLQMVPLPIAPQGPAVPMEPLFASARMGRDGLGTIPAFPFPHSFVRLDRSIEKAPLAAAQTTFQLYSSMLTSLGMQAPAADRAVKQSGPYCFLAAREWMLLVPRSREFFDGVSFNSLAYAGSLFVRDEQQLERIRSFGPLRALAKVALPQAGASDLS